jgi:hypothetical protein
LSSSSSSAKAKPWRPVKKKTQLAEIKEKILSEMIENKVYKPAGTRVEMRAKEISRIHVLERRFNIF